MRRTKLASLALAIIVPLGCGGSDSSGSVTNPGFSCNSTSGTFSATVNGQAWSACGQVAVRRDSSFLGGKDTLRSVSWAGTGFITADLAYAIVMTASKLGPLTPGTYAVGLVNPTGSNAVIGGSNSAGWGASSTGGSGSITFTSITNNHVTGTFTFDVAPVTGSATGTLQIRNGKFDLSY